MSFSLFRGAIFSSLMALGALSAAHAQQADPKLIEQGRYVSLAGDCAACHTNAGGKPFAGGRPIGSPMGNIYASNITPSATNGIGGYTEQQFADALRKGVNAKGQHLYPAMPYTAYRGLSDEDMHALYVYFMQGVQPVDNAVQKTKLPFPYGMRGVMFFWNTLYLDSGSFKASDTASAAVNRGHYLVDTLGHCSSCHSPRNLLMAEQSGAYLAGAKIDGWIAPNITSDPVSGIGGWSTDEIARYLKNGHVDGKGQAGGGMAEAVEQSLRYLSDDDLTAIATYLKTVKPVRDPKDSKAAYEYAGGSPLPSISELEPQRPDNSANPDAMRDVSTTDGTVLYSGACASCHQPGGKGTENQYFPSLSHNSATGMSSPDNVVMTILHGIERQGADAHVLMPAFGRDMNDEQVAAVTNYVTAHFGNPDARIDAAGVAQIRAGGPRPLLIRLTPWLMGGGVVVALLVIWLIVSVVSRRRRRRR
ncbi:mono/diheme cytochrome c family protein [Luteibacter sp. Sphag1AF]|uniref:cytochrome c n=1 Tax=Luteibacter sp. Sphag1AF TaxID=2587031 RepID=UPI00160EAA68|nr:cytochrome c [Luteibacter sp. Sphag1AF]MBB3226476.1 mono/diheme cytochrome c family protein [Luteibacter sp. Sphag1AF]